jgi:capsule biosynthesis phosphatase
LSDIRNNKVKCARKMRFCFDLDNTLVSYPLKEGDYSTVEPVWRNIILVRELKAAGHYIIIYTARRMKTHSGNVGKILKDVGHITFDTLSKFDIPYDELCFGKPHADLYIDDLAVNSLVDTEKEIGWFHADIAPDKGFITPRSFNTINFSDDSVMKSAKKEILEGEIYFYRNIPKDIKHLFPTLRGSDTGSELNWSLSIDKILGVTYSHLITAHCVTKQRLLNLLNSLNTIHNSSGNGENVKVDIYSNYAEKLKSRYSSYPSTYANLPDHARCYKQLLAFLEDYEKGKRGILKNVIHGDPVFSNVLLTSKNLVYFIDMRGALGNTMTLQGDVMYDLSKVYQSLCGYDFIILNKPLTAGAVQYLNELKQIFWQFIKETYGSIIERDIIGLTAALYFSLIPYHDNVQSQSIFYTSAMLLVNQMNDVAEEKIPSNLTRAS